MHTKRLGWLALCLMLPLGCGAGGLATDAGTGSGTLRVDATVSATESVQGAQLASQFNTEFNVQVSKSGTPVVGAQVVISTSAGPLTLSAGNPTGSYRGSMPGYLQTYGLDVTAGDDNIHGAKVEGPPFHVITAPLSASTQKASLPLTVTWSPGGAPEATIETEKLTETATTDSGMYVVPGTYLAGEPGKLKEDRVRIRRTQRTLLAGGTAGSSLVVRIRNEAQFLLDGR